MILVRHSCIEVEKIHESENVLKSQMLLNISRNLTKYNVTNLINSINETIQGGIGIHSIFFKDPFSNDKILKMLKYSVILWPKNF